MITALVDTTTNEFLQIGRPTDQRFVRVPLPRNPDPLVERWSGDPAAPFTPKPAQEISDAAAASVATRADAQAMSEADQKILKALSQALWECIPAPTLTKPQLRARILAIWKALP